MKAEPKWYVAQVLTGSEAETARRLTEAGMEAIAPVQVLHERRHGVWRLMRRTVFPGYVFVRVALIPRTYYHIQRQPQVVRLLGGAAPEAVPEEEMAVVLLFARSGRDFGVSCGERSNGPAGADRKGEPKGAQGNGGADRPGRGPPDRGGARCGTGRPLRRYSPSGIGSRQRRRAVDSSPRRPPGDIVPARSTARKVGGGEAYSMTIPGPAHSWGPLHGPGTSFRCHAPVRDRTGAW